MEDRWRRFADCSSEQWFTNQYRLNVLEAHVWLVVCSILTVNWATSLKAMMHPTLCLNGCWIIVTVLPGFTHFPVECFFRKSRLQDPNKYRKCHQLVHFTLQLIPLHYSQIPLINYNVGVLFCDSIRCQVVTLTISRNFKCNATLWI